MHTLRRLWATLVSTSGNVLVCAIERFFIFDIIVWVSFIFRAWHTLSICLLVVELRVDLFLTRWAKITHFAVIKRFVVSVGDRRFKNDVLRFNRKFTIAGFCVLSTFFLILFTHLELNHALQDTLLESNVFHSHLVHHLNVLFEKSVEVVWKTSLAAAHKLCFLLL